MADVAHPWPKRGTQQARRAGLWNAAVPWSRALHDAGAEGLWRWPSGLLVPVRMQPAKANGRRYMVRSDVRRKRLPAFRADIEFGTVRLLPPRTP